MSAPASIADKTGFYLLAICGVVAPLPFGSNTATSAGMIGLLLAICLLGSPLVPPLEGRARRLFGGIALLAGLLAVLITIQALPWSALSAPIGASPGTDPPTSAEPPMGLHLQPLQSVGYVLIPIAAFMSALIYIRDDARHVTFLHILLGASFFVSTLCIVEYLVSPQTVLLTPKKHYLESFTGTFINPNTAASYFGTMALLSLSLCLRQLASMRRRMVSTAVRNPHQIALVIYCIWTVVFAIALTLTRSRAGILSSFVAIVGFTTAFAFMTMRDRGLPAKSIAIRTLAAVTAVILIFALTAQQVIHRVEVQGLVEKGRLCTYLSTWRAIQDHFWLGTGLGTFQDVFPAYRSPECGLNGYWEMAHSVFLEGWLSLGAAFFPIVLITYTLLLKTYVHGCRHRRRMRFAPLASLAILGLLTLHSLVDFSVQIPGMAIVAALILGAGATVSLAPKEPRV